MRNNLPARVLAAWLMLGVGLVSPAEAKVFSPETATLENGLQVVVIPNHRAPVVTHMLWLRAGALSDPWGKSGVAHFLEHLMFKGTKKNPKGAYSKIISHMGGEENAFTSYDYTAYYASVGKQHLDSIMALEADRLANIQFDEKEIAVERDVVLKERQQRTENDPVNAFFEEVNGVLFPNHPYQRPVIGWRHEIAALTRDDAETFFRQHYAPNNLILVLSGDITLNDVLPMVKKHYAALPARNIDPRPLLLVPESESQREIIEHSPLVQQEIWSRHVTFPPATPQTIAQSDALVVLSKILGDGRTGRLYRRLVIKEKLATQAYVTFDPVSFGPARFTLAATPTPKADMKAIERIIDEEIAKMAHEKVGAEELKKATQALEIEAVYARDSVMGPAMIVGEALVNGLDITTIEAWPERMQAVSAEAVQEQAKRLAEKNAASVTAILLPEPQPQKAAK